MPARYDNVTRSVCSQISADLCMTVANHSFARTARHSIAPFTLGERSSFATRKRSFKSHAARRVSRVTRAACAPTNNGSSCVRHRLMLSGLVRLFRLRLPTKDMSLCGTERALSGEQRSVALGNPVLSIQDGKCARVVHESDATLLLWASGLGLLPPYAQTSPCLQQMRAHPLSSLRFNLFNSISIHLWYTKHSGTPPSHRLLRNPAAL